jgi:hypothetical protein
MPGKLEVIVDGVPLPETEARAFWRRFSDHMEANKGDLAGFARSEGLASVHPAMGPNGARLVGSRSAPQRPYAPARDDAGGSPERQGGGGRAHRRRGRSSFP